MLSIWRQPQSRVRDRGNLSRSSILDKDTPGFWRPDNVGNLNGKILPANGSTRVPLQFADDVPQLASDVLKRSI